MTRDSVPKNSASIANRVFKKLRVKTRDDYVITPSEVVCSAEGVIRTKELYERMQTYLHTNASYNYLDQTCDGFSSIKTQISGSVFLPLKVNR